MQLDQNPAQVLNLALAGEDVLVRWALGTMSGGVEHTVTVTHTGSQGATFYFDFLEIAIPTTNLPVFATDSQTTLATDWDTLNSQALAPERTAWQIQSLGFTGRANHYAGALWFYELTCTGQQYATGTITFSGTSSFGAITQIALGPTNFTHLNLIGDTPASLAQAFALLINEGATGVWAQADAGVLTITARVMGSAGNGLTLRADVGTGAALQAQTSGALAGGVDGTWLTDLTATPRINRAARDWSQSFYTALNSYGIEVTVSFSTELGNGDPSTAAGIAQCYPDGSPCHGEHAGFADEFLADESGLLAASLSRHGERDGGSRRAHRICSSARCSGGTSARPLIRLMVTGRRSPTEACPFTMPIRRLRFNRNMGGRCTCLPTPATAPPHIRTNRLSCLV